MRGVDEARGDQFANSGVDPLFQCHVERRRQAPHLTEHHVGVLRTAEVDLVARADAAEQHYGTALGTEAAGNRGQRR